MCFWPAVTGAHVGCAVCAVSAAFCSWVSFCFACLSSAGNGGAVCLVAVFCFLLLLLWVVLPCCFCCGSLFPWPLVAPCPVVSRLGFFLCRWFRLGLGGWGPVWDPPFFWGGLSFPCPRCFRLAFPTFVVQAP